MKTKAILLVSPWIHDFAAYDFWIRPLGLLRVGRLLLRSGHEVHLLDLLNHEDIPAVSRNQGRPPRRFASGQGKFYREEIPKPPSLAHIPRKYCRYGLPPWYAGRLLDGIPEPGYVLVASLMTYWYPGVQESISFIKSRWPDVPVILGGIWPILCPEHARRESGADLVISGRVGENSDDLSFLLDIDGAGTPGEDEYWPALELYDRIEGLPLATSEGCPHRCPYCASRKLVPRFQARSPEEVTREVAHWHRLLGAKHFTFFDDALLAEPREHFLPLAEKISSTGLPLDFHAANGLHVESIDREVAAGLRRMGVATLRLGLETALGRNDPAMGLKASRESFLKALSHLEEAGYRRGEIGVYLMAGLPGQGAGEVAESIRWVTETGAVPYLSYYSPIPGTALWEEACRASPYPLEEDPLFQNNTILPCSWKGFTLEDLPRLKALIN